MCTRGIWQLRNLTLYYCKHSGSSRFVREFLEDGVAAYQKANPQINIESVVRSGKHPYLHGQYINGFEKTCDLKNEPVADIVRCMQQMRNTIGKKVTKDKKYHKTRTPSVQGEAHIWMDM